MHLIFVAFSFCISVDELFADEWGEAGKRVDFSTARKFVAIQTIPMFWAKFSLGDSQQNYISLHHQEIWSQMCLSHM